MYPQIITTEGSTRLKCAKPILSISLSCTSAQQAWSPKFKLQYHHQKTPQKTKTFTRHLPSHWKITYSFYFCLSVFLFKENVLLVNNSCTRVLLWHFHTCLQYTPVWFISLFSLSSLPLLKMAFTGFNVHTYLYMCRKYTNHIHPPLPSSSP
jgi:hypothetical protein